MAFDPRRQFWNEAYASGAYRKHWHSEEPLRELVELVASGGIRPGGTVLDLGCGAGTDTRFLARRGFRAIGVDVSTEALRRARESSSREEDRAIWCCADVLSLPIADQEVDFVFDRGCFHLIGEESRVRYAREVERILEPGGGLLLIGARSTDEEEGLVAVDDEAAVRCFEPGLHLCGPAVPSRLEAEAGVLAANLLLVAKPAASD